MELEPLFVNMVAILAIIGGVAIAVWFVVGLYAVYSRRREDELPRLEVPSGIQEVKAGVPLALKLFYAFIALSMIAYVLVIWLTGVTY